MLKNKDAKTWTRPELIVLMRNHPEETVLLTDCKTPDKVGPNDQTCAAGNAPNIQCYSSNNPS